MYLRNVKQIFRQATPAFDERAYGYGNLVDLLRAAQKDGVVRLDRDRQGVVRVFQGRGGRPSRPCSVGGGVALDAALIRGRNRSQRRRAAGIDEISRSVPATSTARRRLAPSRRAGSRAARGPAAGRERRGSAAPSAEESCVVG